MITKTKRAKKTSIRSINRVASLKRAALISNLKLDIYNLQRKYATELVTIVAYDSNSQIMHMAGPGDIDYRS